MIAVLVAVGVQPVQGLIEVGAQLPGERPVIRPAQQLADDVPAQHG